MYHRRLRHKKSDKKRYAWPLNYRGFESYLTYFYCTDLISLHFEFRNNIRLRFCRKSDYPQDFWSVFVYSHGKYVAEGFCQSEDAVRVLKWAIKLKDGWNLKENEQWKQ